jgi:hypothetical protein
MKLESVVSSNTINKADCKISLICVIVYDVTIVCQLKYGNDSNVVSLSG